MTMPNAHSMLDIAHSTCGGFASALGVAMLAIAHERQVHSFDEGKDSTKGHKGNVSLMKV